MTPTKNAISYIQRLGGLLLAVSFVAGCEAISDQVMDTVQGKVELSCPKSNIIADAAKRLEFRPGTGRDLVDIDNEISLSNVSIGCKSDVNRRTLSGNVTATVIVNFAVARGPANRDRRADFKYFVSVTDLADKILYREAFDLAMQFQENQSRGQISGEPIDLEIPMRAGQDGDSYRILVGMILTREQLKLNRVDRRSRL